MKSITNIFHPAPFGARYYQSTHSFWLSVDPLADKYPNLSPYTYCAENPVRLVDEDGRRISPIYDLEGNFLGTDDNGLQGEAFFMESTDFEQGMDPSVAQRLNRGFESLKSNAAKERYEKHYNNLSTRPDWDGKLTLEDANDWYRNGNGQPLFVSLEKIDLSGLVSLGESFVGQEKVVSLKWASGSINDALVYGKITLKRYPNHRVRAYADNYNFDVKPWRNPLNWTRNIATKIGKMVAGEGVEYEINIYGSQKLSPILPWIK